MIDADGKRRLTDETTISIIEDLATLLTTAVGWTRKERLVAVTPIVLDAGIDPAHISPV